MNKKLYKKIQELESYKNLISMGVLDITSEDDLKKGNFWLKLPFVSYESSIEEDILISYSRNANYFITKELNIYYMKKMIYSEDTYSNTRIFRITSEELKKMEIPLLKKYDLFLQRISRHVFYAVEEGKYLMIDIENETFVKYIIDNYMNRLHILLKYEPTISSVMDFLYKKGYLGDRKLSVDLSQIF